MKNPRSFSQGTRVKARSFSATVEDKMGTWERRSEQPKLNRLGSC